MPSNTSLLFETDELSPWLAGLDIYKTLKTARKVSVSRIEIEVHNTRQHYIVLPGQTQRGSLELVKYVTNMEVKMAEPNSDRVAEPECTETLYTTALVEKGEPLKESNDVIPDMCGLTSEQLEIVGNMLKEEADDDISFIKSLKMDIDLSASTPLVKRNYVPVSRPLYQKVTNYIEDLLTKIILQVTVVLLLSIGVRSEEGRNTSSVCGLWTIKSSHCF